jgi:ABC-type nitrate/sulfonate/bicarbonate transport system permease component
VTTDVSLRNAGPGSARQERRWLAARRRIQGGAGRAALPWGVLLAFGIVWQVVTTWADQLFFPTMTEILGRAYQNYLTGPAHSLFLTETVYNDVVPSVTRLLAGWLLAVAIGVSLGAAIGLIRSLADYVDPIVQFARAIPPPSLIPLFMVLLGIQDSMKIALICFGVVWPILLNTIDGVRSVERVQTDTGRVFGISPLRRLTHIVLPSASPKIFAGFRVSMAIAVILMVISEMVAATNGIGFTVLQAQRSFRILDMWAGLLMLSIIGYALNTAILRVEDRVLRWHRGAYGGVS